MSSKPEPSQKLAIGAAGVETQKAAPGMPWRVVLLIVVSQVISAVACTQYLAYQFAYQPALGEPLFTVLGHSIYQPWTWVVDWVPRFWRVSAAGPLWYSVLVIQVLWLLGIMAYVFATGMFKPKGITASTLHGSAHWASEAEIQGTGLMQYTFETEPLAPAVQQLDKIKRLFRTLGQRVHGMIWIDSKD